MSSGNGHVSDLDEIGLMEDASAQYVQIDRRTDADASPQVEPESHLDDSEPEYASESDGAEDIFFKPSPSLPSPNVIKRTLRELNDLMNTPYLNLDSSEHRPRRCEGNDTLTEIIDSLSQNYEFPPIYFNQKQARGPDGSIQYNRVCIDGLKRLSAIKAFMDGEIHCHDYRRRKWFYCVNVRDGQESSVAGTKRVLPGDDKENFQNKHFVCYEFEDLTRPEEIELRARVHLGNALTPGEKLRATMIFSGELMINFAKTLESEYQQLGNIADTGRMKGFQNLMKCCSQIFEIQQAGAENRPPLLRISETALIEFIKNADGPALEKIKESLGVLCILVARHPELFKPVSGAPFRPMEMIVIAVLTFKYYQTKINPWKFIRLVESLRESIHQFSRHQGVLQTCRNWAHAWNFIQHTEQFIVEDEILDLGQEVNKVAQTRNVGSVISEQNATTDLDEHTGSRTSTANFCSAHSFPGTGVRASPSSNSQRSTAVKRKASPQPLGPAKKRVQLPTPVSPKALQSHRSSLRVSSPDSVLGSVGSENDQVAETSGSSLQEAPSGQNDSSTSAPRQLVRSSFKSNSEYVPRRSESPRPNSSVLETLIASVLAPPSSSKAVASSLPDLNILTGASQRPATKPSLLYSHETKKTIPYQSSGALSSVEPSPQLVSRHVTPVGQNQLVGNETPSIPPYSGRGRPRKYPPKPATPEGLTPRKSGRPRKSPVLTVSDFQRVHTFETRGQRRERKSIPGGFSTIPYSTPSAQSPPPDLQMRQEAGPLGSEHPPKNVTLQPVDVEDVELDRSQELGPDITTIPLPNMVGETCRDKSDEAQSPAAPAKSSQASNPPKCPTPPVPAAQSVFQPRAVSSSSSREASVSHFSTVGSLSTISPRTTPDPALIDAKPFVVPFKVGGANAILERRRQHAAEREEKKRRKQEAEKLAKAGADSGTPKV